MKLLHIESRSVVELPDTELPPYAILSYTRAGSLCTTQAQLSTSCKRHICSSFQDQVTRACDDTISRGITYLWVQSLCINTSSSAELDDGVNGSFRRLIRSSVCLVYLADLPADGPSFDKAIWAQCAYWKRAWTLQELILPSKVEFFDKQWNHRGSKASPELLPLFSNITGIPKRVLLDPNALSEVSLAGRMSWAVDRIASREEDTAYSLGAITGVTIPVRYGEGAERAFLRLQEEILHDTRDGSIFAWRSVHNQNVRGLLARSPSEFRHFAIASGSAWEAPWIFDGKVQFSSKGIQVQSRISKHGSCILLEIGRRVQDNGSNDKFGVFLREWNGIYVRVDPGSEASIFGTGLSQTLHTARDIDSRTSIKISVQFNIMDRQISSAVQQGIHSDNSSNNTTYGLLERVLTTKAMPHDKQHTTDIHYQLPWRLAPGLESSTRNPLDDECRHVSPVFEPSGTKRKMSGLAIPSSQSRKVRGRQFSLASFKSQEDDISSSSESEQEDSSSSGGYSSNEDLHSEDDTTGECDLDTDPQFQGMRADMLEFLCGEIRTWVASARYGEPPDNRLPPRKRAKPTDWPCQSTYFEEKEDPNDSQLVIVSHLDGYFHLACPFYVSNPARYQECLLKHDLQSIEGVIRHVRKHHTEPPYCPICRQSFYKAVDLDKHVRARICKSGGLDDIDGVNEHQKAQLIKRDKLYLGEKERWHRVWTTIFPNTEFCPSPYLGGGVELAIAMTRDHWALHGRDYIAQWLANYGLLLQYDAAEEKRQAAISGLMLQDILSVVAKEGRATGGG